MVEKEDVLEIVQRLNEISPTFKNKTILITGGCGFLGKVFRDYFLQLGHCQVITIDNFVTGSRDASQNANLIQLQQSITEPVTIDQSIDYIINAAGIASPYHYRRLPLETLDVSYLGTRNMLQLAIEHKVKSFLAFSSSEVYGDPKPPHIPTPESYCGTIETMNSRSMYDEGKRVIETLCYIYNTKYGVNTKIVRPFNVFGPPLLQNDYRVIPNFISRAMQKQPLLVYGDGQQTRTFCYITDFIVGAIKMLLGGDNLPYNIGNSDNEICMIDLANLVQESLGKKLDIRIIEYPSVYPHNEPRRRCPDLTKAKMQLAYYPIVSIKEGILRFYKWATVNYI